jgi:hypothetical protein
MTWEQWLFEYHALAKKEEAETQVRHETMKTCIRAFREILVGVLGLGQLVPNEEHEKAKKDAKDGEPPLTPFVPAAFVFGNHHLLQGLIKKVEESEDVKRVTGDEAADFEAFSQKLARGEDSDIDPILLGEIPNLDQVLIADQRRRAAELGVRTRAPDAPAAPKGGRPRGVVFDDAAAGAELPGGMTMAELAGAEAEAEAGDG